MTHERKMIVTYLPCDNPMPMTSGDLHRLGSNPWARNSDGTFHAKGGFSAFYRANCPEPDFLFYQKQRYSIWKWPSQYRYGLDNTRMPEYVCLVPTSQYEAMQKEQEEIKAYQTDPHFVLKTIIKSLPAGPRSPVS